jgi:radical SAM-linked protein
MDQVKRVRKTGFTLAPEAGSERLRRVINKGITEADLLTTCQTAFSLGWQAIKLYFMIGLPSETEQDIIEIAQLARKILTESGKVSNRGKKQITVSVGTFIPKPHTPFQWERQLNIEESRSRIHRLRESLPPKVCNLRYHSPRQSFLEGVFARGDRRLAELTVKAWTAGARFDGWDEHFELSRWQRAAEECQLDLERYLRARATEEILPWDHLNSGVSRQFLLDEREKAKAELYTPDCRYHACQKCGLCDFKTLQPIVCNRNGNTPPPPSPASPRDGQILAKNSGTTGHHKYIVHYSRLGKISYLGHLEMLQGILRTLNRAAIATNFSQGFHPTPKISFGPALATGTESTAEFFIMDLPNPLPNCAEAAARLNEKLVPGLRIIKIEPHSGKVPQSITTWYSLTLARELTEPEKERIALFLGSTCYPVAKTRKGKTSTIDIRPLIPRLKISGPTTIELELVGISAQPGIKPIEALARILDLDEQTVLATRILKTGWRAVEFDSGKHRGEDENFTR